MPSSHFRSSHDRTTSGMAFHHRLSAAQTVERRKAWHSIIAFGLAHIVGRCRAWHAIIALGRKTWSNDIGLGITSLPLDSTHGRTTSGVASNRRLLVAHMVERHRTWHAIRVLGQQTRLNNVGRGMPSPPLDNIYGRMTSGVACHHGPLIAHTVEPHRALYAIIALG